MLNEFKLLRSLQSCVIIHCQNNKRLINKIVCRAAILVDLMQLTLLAVSYNALI